MTAPKTTFEPQNYRLDLSDDERQSSRGQDTRDGSIYVYSDAMVNAVRVALATGRPLLLYGPPGSGKSSFAAYVAREMGWNYFEQVVTSRTQATDFQYTVDAVRRLQDAQAKKLHPTLEPYIEPRSLWWAFDPTKAKQRGAADELPDRFTPPQPPGDLRGEDCPAVLLIDEIDKADPDVPNDLLVAIGSKRLAIRDLGLDITPTPGREPLIFITSNRERKLPPAFLRRCLVHELDHPSKERLVTIAEAHFAVEDGDGFPERNAEKRRKLFEALGDLILTQRKEHEPGQYGPPSTAEFLDAVQACLRLNVAPHDDSDYWAAIESAVFAKDASE